jgi:HK97 family phage prohead protease
MIDYLTVPFAEFKSADEGSGTLEGTFSVFGNQDRLRDVVEHKAFEDDLPRFVQQGFIAWGHDWKNPIATPVEAKETDSGLFVSGEFHSTPYAQERRLLARERVARGKSLGGSIGYEVKQRSFKDRGGSQIRHIEKAELFEVTMTLVPVNDAAQVTGVKGLTFSDEADTLVAQLKEYVARAEAIASLRQQEGKHLGAESKDRIDQIIEELQNAAGQLVSLTVEQANETTQTGPDPERDRFERLYSRITATFAGAGNVYGGSDAI